MTRVSVDRGTWTVRLTYDPSRVTVARIQSVLDAAADAADAKH